VDDAGGRVATGFLGTPLVLPALAATGHFEQAYRMLLCTDVPSWLYQVGKGATTVWERWDAIRPDGSLHPGTLKPVPGSPEGTPDGHMLSFNHYAYGAVIDWVYRHLAGLAPDIERPGYRRTRFAPRPVAGISWARGRVATTFGDAAIEWRVDDQATLTARLEVPPGTEATFTAPTTRSSEVVVDGVRATGGAALVLGQGVHTVVVTATLVLRVDGTRA
jgi:alpha-L-rhamnosidase